MWEIWRFLQLSVKMTSRKVFTSLFRSQPKVKKLNKKENIHTPNEQAYSERRVVGYSAQQMFDVVSKVEDYYKFVPFCKKSDVTSREENVFTADMGIGFPPVIYESYTATVTLIEPHLVTSVCTDLKIFHHLKSVWKFSPTDENDPNSCIVDFAVSFEFHNSAYNSLTRMFMDELAKSDVAAFLNWAETKYGKPKPVSKKYKPSVIVVKT